MLLKVGKRERGAKSGRDLYFPLDTILIPTYLRFKLFSYLCNSQQDFLLPNMLAFALLALLSVRQILAFAPSHQSHVKGSRLHHVGPASTSSLFLGDFFNFGKKEEEAATTTTKEEEQVDEGYYDEDDPIEKVRYDYILQLIPLILYATRSWLLTHLLGTIDLRSVLR